MDWFSKFEIQVNLSKTFTNLTMFWLILTKLKGNQTFTNLNWMYENASNFPYYPEKMIPMDIYRLWECFKLAKWIWRKVHHGQQYLIFLPLFLVSKHHCFIFFFLLGFQLWKIIIGTPVFEEMLKLNFGLDVWNPIVYARTMLFIDFF